MSKKYADRYSITNWVYCRFFTPHFGEKIKEKNRSDLFDLVQQVLHPYLKHMDAGRRQGQEEETHFQHHSILSSLHCWDTTQRQHSAWGLWYDIGGVPNQHCQIENTLEAIWKSAVLAKQQREKSRAKHAHCLQQGAMGYKPQFSPTQNTCLLKPLTSASVLHCKKRVFWL